MRSLVMKSLAAMMCVGAMLALGVAMAGEAQQRPPAGYRIVQENAHIRAFTPIVGFHVIDANTILIRSGDGQFVANLMGLCAQGSENTLALGISNPGSGDIDRSSDILVNGRACGILSLNKVEPVAARH